jgi:drug/metabolite transporter (DMT)-like permease
LESVTAAVAGVIILKQSMSVSEALGCIIMFCAIILSQLPMPKKK